MTKTFRAFDPRAIRAGLAADTRTLLRQLTVLEVVDSTNLFLQRLPVAQQHGHAVVADRQESGRGRRGRSWHSPPGGNIYLSVGWQFAMPADALLPLPLVVAVTVARALQQAGLRAAGIKWPNDILVDGRKLAGILVELRQHAAEGAGAVIGVGVNVSMPTVPGNENPIEQAWTDICSQVPEPLAEDFRDSLCGLLLGELLRGLELFASQGFAAFAADWARLDILHGRAVNISVSGRSHAGNGQRHGCRNQHARWFTGALPWHRWQGHGAGVPGRGCQRQALLSPCAAPAGGW